MYATHPKMAKKWAAHTKDTKDLPEMKEKKDPKAGIDFERKPAADDVEASPAQDMHGKNHPGSWPSGTEKFGQKTLKSPDFKRKPAADDPGVEKHKVPASVLAPSVSDRSGIDVAKLRNPQGFVTSVHGFINRMDHDIDVLKHFSDTYSKSKSLDKTPKLDMLKLSKEIDALRQSVEPHLTQMGKDLKAIGNRLQKRDVSGPDTADVRSPSQKKKDTQAYMKRPPTR